jgi:hypothetical protein
MTLTESCVAALVVFTVMATSLPAVNRARKIYTLRSAAHEVAARMHSTRIAAITRNRDCRMRVTSSTSYVIECEDTLWTIIEHITLPKGIAVAANGRPEFHRRGNVSPTATFTVRNDAGIVRIIVNVNGRVRLQ